MDTTFDDGVSSTASSAMIAPVGNCVLSPTSSPLPLSNATNSNTSEWVSLQFDDRVFTMMRSALCQDEGSLFKVLFSGDSVSSSGLARNTSHPMNPVVFDRPARFVEPILNFLRTGDLVIPGAESDPALFRGVYNEAAYFCVQGVLELLADIPEATESQLDRIKRERAAKSKLGNTATRIEVERMLMALPTTCGAPSFIPPLVTTPLPRWCGMRFNGVDFTELNLSGINLSGCEMNRCKFVRCDMSYCVMDGAEFEESDFTQATLIGVKCRGSNLHRAKFHNANCKGSDFANALLIEVDFSQCNLAECNLQLANMSSCVLMGANLKDAKMLHARLTGVERQGTSLSMGGVISN